MIPAKNNPPPRHQKMAKRWILTIILLVVLPFTASWYTMAQGSNTSAPSDLQVEANLTPTATPKSTLAVKATRTAKASAAAKATETTKATTTTAASPTATATRTSPPTTTMTPEPSSTLVTRLKVWGNTVYLRNGPGYNFTPIRKLDYGEMVTLLGRLSNPTWLYVGTADGLEGWIETAWVNLTGVDVDNRPIITPSPYPDTTVKVAGSLVYLRAGPSFNFSKTRKLANGEPLKLLGRLSDNTWLYVKTSDGQEGWVATYWVNLGGINLDERNFPYPIKTPPATETATLVVLEGVKGHWIDIDLSEQKLRAFDGSELVRTFLVSTGVSQYPTEIGQYRVLVKLRYSDMRGPDYFLPDVPYSMYYNNDFSIHGTYWHHNFGTPMSHGCVNMDIPDAEWLYNWAEIGTLVNIHR